MRCPFLREAQVKSCGASEFKKMIVRIPSQPENETNERCSSQDYVDCPWVRQRHEEFPNQTRCPFLQESLAQYCSAASVVKYVPYSDPGLSRCGTSGHRYCELFLMISHPNLVASHEVDAPTLDSGDIGPWIVDGIQTTGWHFYSANHMWLEIDEEGNCHVGVDPFFAKVIGGVDKLTFTASYGKHHPGVVMTLNGVDLSLVFPNRMNITAANSHLRADPHRVAADPYTFGWLFEGVEAKISGEPGISRGLIHGRDARTWMQNETRRLSEFIHERLAGRSESEGRLAADGGTFGGEPIKNLDKEQILILYNEFFSPHP